jgi:hypothetical protein
VERVVDSVLYWDSAAIVLYLEVISVERDVRAIAREQSFVRGLFATPLQIISRTINRIVEEIENTGFKRDVLRDHKHEELLRW